MKPKVGISRCLIGDAVRYDGGHKRHDTILAAFGDLVEWVPVCPEVEAGMSTPREAIDLVPGRDGQRLIGVVSGVDWTAPMRAFAAARTRQLATAGLSGYILKSGSPSCGLEGPGLFARALLAAFPGLPIEDEQRLQDHLVRAAFLRRVLDYRA